MAIIKINKQNFYYNLNQITLQTGSVDKIAIVLKDNAYGHGLALIAKLASEYGIRQAVVRNASEADTISMYFDTILVLGDHIKKDRYTYVINSLTDMNTAEKGAKVELKVDTGMHRNGVALDEVSEALEMIKKQGLTLVGLMTHYRSADVLSSEFFWQQKCFDKVKKQVHHAGYTNIRIHSHNSASILRTKSFDEDLVRVGIAAYGYNELDDTFSKITLKPVLSLYAQKTATRVLKKGERVGYSGDYIAQKSMQISTYNLGYGDGWCRALYNDKPFITAEALPILGRVSMDFISLESNAMEICIVDNAQDAARQLGTISYEVMTSLHADVKRVVV
jgi:alanine racemase